MSKMSSPRQLIRAGELAADWWGSKLLPEHADNRGQFEQELQLRVTRTLADSNPKEVMLEVDYDPQGLLLDALRAANIPCSGQMCSADEVFGFRKSWMRVEPSVITISHGYAARWQFWAVSEEAEAEDLDQLEDLSKDVIQVVNNELNALGQLQLSKREQVIVESIVAVAGGLMRGKGEE